MAHNRVDHYISVKYRGAEEEWTKIMSIEQKAVLTDEALVQLKINSFSIPMLASELWFPCRSVR